MQLDSYPEKRDFNKLSIFELVILSFIEYVCMEHLAYVNLIKLI